MVNFVLEARRPQRGRIRGWLKTIAAGIVGAAAIYGLLYVALSINIPSDIGEEAAIAAHERQQGSK